MRVVLFLFLVFLVGCKSSHQQITHNINSEINDEEIKELIAIADNYITRNTSGFYIVSFSVEYSDYKILINREKERPCYHNVDKYPLKPFLKKRLSGTEIYYYASFLKSKFKIMPECDKNFKVTDFGEKKFTLLSVCGSNMENIKVISGVDVDRLFKETKRKFCN